jgi:hypothetical protein
VVDEPESAVPSSAAGPAGAEPPAQPGGRAPRSRLRTAALAAAGVVVVGAPCAAAIALALHRNGGGAPSLETLLPTGSDVYAVADLDPSLTDKVQLLLHHFPDLRTQSQLQSKLRAAIDDGLRPTGLSYEKDVQPWLGSQLAAAGNFDGGNAVFLLASKDDSAARHTLAALRSGPQGSKYGWTDGDYHGVTVSSGTPRTTSETQKVVYTLVDHVAVLGTNATLVDAVVDAAQGRHAALPSDGRFTQTMRQLPSDRLGFVYVDGPAVARQLRSSSGLSSSNQSPGLGQALSQLDALRGIGVALTVQSGSVTADATVSLDPGKLDADTRRQLTSAPHDSAALSFVPAHAYGFVATTGLQSATRALSDYLDRGDPSNRQTAERLGLLGSNGVLAHLTGDLAVEVGPGSGRFPGGALLLGTSDEAGMSAFLDRAAGLAAAATSSDTGTSSAVAPVPHTEAYHGVAVHWLTVPGLEGSGVEPAYAVSGGMAIVASSPDEVKAVVDAHAGGGITSTATFIAASHAAPGPGTTMYLDLGAITGAVRKALPAQALPEFDQQIAPNLAPLRAFIVTGGGGADHVGSRLVLLTR